MSNDREPRWTAGGPDVDLADPALCTGGRYPVLWRQAREQQPIAWTESPRAGRFWPITGYIPGSRLVKHASVEVAGDVVRQASAFLHGLRKLGITSGSERRAP
jgi:hypothetical protein